MAEYEQSKTIDAAPDTIFDFVADIANLPKYLPTTKHAQPQQGERVRIQGGGDGFQYDADGYLRADHEQHRLEWGADERYYSGYLEITPKGEDASEVTVHLTFNAPPPGAESGEGPSDADIEQGIRAALESIENQVKGQGGKVEPPAARESGSGS